MPSSTFLPTSGQGYRTIEQGETVRAFYDEGDSWPITLSTSCTSIAFINTDASNALSFTLTYDDDTTITGTVPASSTYDGHFSRFKSMAATTSTMFVCEVRK